MSKEPIVFISCGIFKEELEYLVKEKGLDWNILYLDAALHVNFDKLKAQLVQSLEKARHEGVEPRVLYGHCHPEILEIINKFGARKMNAGNCIKAFVGDKEMKRLDSEAKSFFLTAGWVNNWRKMFDLGKADFNFDFKSMFANYKRVIVFETHIIPVDESSVQEFSKFTNLPIERKTLTLDHFLDLIEHLYS